MAFTFTHTLLQMSARRFIYWGKAYRIATFRLLSLIALGLILGVPLASNTTRIYLLRVIVPVLIVANAFLLLSRRDVSRLTAKINSNQSLKLQPISQDIGENSLTFNLPSAPPQGTAAQVLAELMCLKSAILFTGPDLVHRRLVASSGEGSEDVLHYLSSHFDSCGGNIKSQNFMELPWESGFLLLIPLTIDGRYIGHAVLGPKESGKIFAEE